MNNSLLRVFIYAFFSVAASAEANWKNFFLQSLPFPLTVGLIYQAGKSYQNNSLHSYLDGKASNFIGYRNEFIIGYNNTNKSTESYCGFPLTVFVAGFFLNKLTAKLLGHSKLNNLKNDVSYLLGGITLTFAYSLIIPTRFNPFLWKNGNGTHVNKIINFS